MVRTSRQRLRLIAVFLRMLPALALVLIAFSHQPLQLGKSDADVAAFALPDGSIPVICGWGSDNSGKAKPGGGCEACRLTASILIPEPPSQLGVSVRWLAAPPSDGRVRTFKQATFSPGAPPTAPPVA